MVLAAVLICRRSSRTSRAFYMTRCWMLTFWGKPRNQHLYDHAHESPILWRAAGRAGGPQRHRRVDLLGVRELLEARARESKQTSSDAAGQSKPASTRPGRRTTPGDDALAAEPAEGGAAPPHAATSARDDAVERTSPTTHGWHLVHTVVFWAFVVGIGLGRR